jgi:hypothetical protein
MNGLEHLQQESVESQKVFENYGSNREVLHKDHRSVYPMTAKDISCCFKRNRSHTRLLTASSACPANIQLPLPLPLTIRFPLP